jgi:hypothetical protein
MEKLIRKILMEEFFTKTTIVEEINFVDLKNYLILNEGVATIKLDKLKEADVLDYIDSFYNKLHPTSNQYVYFDNDTKISFTIEPTIHWIQRFDRSKEPEYLNDTEILDPSTTEGIDLIFSNMDRILRLVQTYDWTKRVMCLKLITIQGGVEYTNIIKITKDVYIKKLYKIILVTQLKGKPFTDSRYTKCSTLKK